MVRRRRSMSKHVDIFKRAPIEESIAPSSADSSKTEVNKPSSASPTPTSSTQSTNAEPSPSSFSFANDPSQSVIAFPEPSSTLTTSSTPTTSSSSSSLVSTSKASISSADPPTTTTTSSSSTGTPTIASDRQDDQSSAISGGAIGAIVAIVVIIILGFAAFFFIKRRQKRKADGTLNNSNDRLNRFSMMGPTYNATGYTTNATAMSQQQHQTYNNMGQSTGGYYNTNNAPMAMPNPYSPPHPAMAQPTQPTMQQQAAVAPLPPAPPMMEQQQQQPTLEPLQLAPPTSASQPCFGAQPLTVAAGSAPEPMSATIITTPTTPEHPDTLWQQQLPQQQSPPMVAAMPSPPQQHVIGTYQIAAGYTPTLADEIEVRIGDHVQVLAEYDDGWCMGTNLTTGQQNGMFPMQCLGPAVSSTVPDPPQQSQLVPNQPQQQINHRHSSLYTGPVAAQAPSMSHAY